MRRRIYFFNDTSRTNHAGCRAVMRSLHYHLPGHYLIATHYVGTEDVYQDALRACDAVFVNGEGTIHHDSPRANFLLDVLRRAQVLGKKTLLANALFQQYSRRHAETIQRLDFFAVREPMSAEFGRELGGEPLVLLDSAADWHFLKKAGRVLRELPEITKGATHPHSPHHGLLDRLDVPQVDLRGKTLEDMIATLRTTEVYVTGQYHGVYAAGFAGIPFVAIPSNSHKIESLIGWSGLPIPICTSAERLEEQIECARRDPKPFQEFNRFLRSRPVFTEEHVATLMGD